VARNESAANKPSLTAKIAAEFFGTFFQTLVAAGVDILYFTGTGHVDYVSRWLARGFITAAMIYAFSGTSGAHIDPAVSIPPQILGGTDGIVWIYAIGPCIGAVLAALAMTLFSARPGRGERKAAVGG
jgi:glycerol uptake facilitator-like aquaporin